MGNVTIALDKKTPVGAPLEARVEKCVRLHPGWPAYRVSNAVTASVVLVRAVMARVGMPSYSSGKGKAAMKAAALQPRVGMNRKEFLQRYDPMTKLLTVMREAIKQIKPQHYYEDHEMRRLAGYSDAVTWRQVAQMRECEFRKCQFRLGDRVIWTDAKSAARELENNPRAKEV